MYEASFNSEPHVLCDATFVTMRECEDDDEGYGILRNGAAVVADGKIAWLGRKADLPADFAKLPSWSADGRLITPGLVECHSHLIFAGDRIQEFAQLAEGKDYSSLVWDGHGIFSTVKATRDASEDSLYRSALRRIGWFASQGVTTIEVKSGYGLDVETELKMLRVGRRLGQSGVARVLTTLLAGHVYPPDVDQEAFIERVCMELIPQAHKAALCDFVEVYCEESIGFSLDDASTILEAAYKRKIPTRMMADHLTDSAGAALAPAFYAKAAAHLNYTDEAAVEALSSTRTTAILLPIPHLELGAKQRPPIEKLRECNVSIAISTGANPGTSPAASLLAAAHFSCAAFGLSPLEALRGITVCAARALDLAGTVGEISPGADADFAVWDAERPEELIYWLGAPLCHATWRAGRMTKHRSKAPMLEIESNSEKREAIAS